MKAIRASFWLAAVMLAGQATTASAFPVTAQLTGDIRPTNPDNLFVDVTIDSIDSNTVQWTVDINSPLHLNIKLDEFYFNLTGVAADYSFYGFNPVGWEVNSTNVIVQGAGGTNFMFETRKDQQSADDVTNTQDLVFFMDCTAVNCSLTEANFINAPTSNSNDAGSGQLGAHLQSLTAAPGESDSGFAFGSYDDEGGPETVPEPGTVALLGLGLTGMAALRRKRV